MCIKFTTHRHTHTRWIFFSLSYPSGFGGLEVPKFAVSNPAEAVGFLGRKILSTPSFGGEVKPLVPCRRFAVCKRFVNLHESRNLGKITTGHLSRPQFHLSLVESLASLRKQRHVAAKVGTSKGGGKQWQTTPKNLPRMQCAKSHIGSITGLWFLPDRPLGLNTNDDDESYPLDKRNIRVLRCCIFSGSAALMFLLMLPVSVTPYCEVCKIFYERFFRGMC